LKEKGHSRAGSDGLVPNFVRIKTECGSSPIGFACVAQTIADVVAGDECDQVLGARINGVDFGVGSRVADGSEDPLDDRYEAKRSTGQRQSSSVRGWVLVSILFPFFWSTKVMVTYSALVARSLSPWSRSVLVADQNTMPFSTMILVLPGLGVVVYSQARLAKKKAPMTRSAVTAGAVSHSSGVPAPLESNNFCSSLGVMAFCRLGAGSTLLYALNKARMLGSILLLSARCRGLVR
jgi:hypothetical protein